MECITEFIEAEDVNGFGIVVNLLSWVSSLFDFGDYVESGDEVSRMSFEDSIIAESFCEMRFSDACIADKDEIASLLDPRGITKSEEVMFLDFWIKVPIELLESSYLVFVNARGSKKSLDTILLPGELLLRKKR